MLNIQEIGTISQRIVQLVDHFCQGNKTAFGRAADIQSGVLAGIVGGRESKPGFEILQKLLTAYPSVNPAWLLFGRGTMLQSGTIEDVGILPDGTYTVTEKQFERIIPFLLEKLAADPGLKAQTVEAHAAAFANAEAAHQVYHVADNYVSRKAQLSVRLGISEEQARQLVVDGRIRAKYIDIANDYMVTEGAVREFLGESK